MNEIVSYDFGRHPVRIEDRNGQPWFALSDICRVLEIANVGSAAARLDDDEKDVVALTDTIGRVQDATVVNESGMYRLVVRSRKESARRFTKWVTSEVLPSTVQTGGDNAGSGGQSHAREIPVSALCSPDPLGYGMPISGDAERAMQDARRESGGAEG